MTTSPRMTVIICTHNPRRETFRRVLEALRGQTAAQDTWDLVVVDNRSDTPIAEWVDVSWHARGRVVIEPELGSTPAHVRGVRESRTPLLVFVDDDNLLADSYIHDAIRIADSHPFLGAWGGSIRGEYEGGLPAWAARWVGLLAIRECPRATWTNEPYGSQSTPVGAGMCIRRTVAEAYVAALEAHSGRPKLGRVGTALMGCEDTEMALTSLDLGLGVGVFPQLLLTHVIPASRLTSSYLLRIAEGRQASIVMMRALRGDTTPHPFSDHPAKRLYSWLRLPFLPSFERSMLLAEVRGHRRGESLAKEWKASRQDQEAT